MLIRVLQRTNAEFVAARCGVHKSQVSRWVAGETEPLPEHKVALMRSYGIPLESWPNRSSSPKSVTAPNR